MPFIISRGYWLDLQVQWDEPSSIPRPDRVSPWELEPLVASTPATTHPVSRNKRARPPVSASIAPNLPQMFGMNAYLYFPYE